MIQSVPTTMTAGQRYTVSLTLRNTGTAPWTAASGYQLVSQAPVDNRLWGLNRVALPAAVTPGSDVTFTFTVTAPATPGSYRFEWRMMQSLVGFGDFTPALDVTVT